MGNRLHIDFETYSSEDLTKVGAYKYCESIAFEILMVAYAYDDEEVKLVALAEGEELPEKLIEDIKNPDIENHAHNATFERLCLAAIGIYTDISNWHCTQVKAASCSLPLQLSKLSEVLKLEEKGKLTTGRALIKLFCTPTKPTRNNNRTRTLWFHDVEKWEQFKAYCINDVIAEREVYSILKPYKTQEKERRLYKLDQEINDRGVEVDIVLTEKAIEVAEENKNNLLARMKTLTGLENPNSPEQLKSWLSEAIDKDIKTLAKKEIPKLLELTASGVVKEVLSLRIETSKTSVKKYIAVHNSFCEDYRVRGLVQFLGAARTGRWAGRLIQVHNLPRNYIDNLDEARTILKNDTDRIKTLAAKVLFKAKPIGNVANILSYLIRTTLVAPKGKKFVVVDFSAIEARVLAWLAGEQWRVDVFKGHGKIYEASASMMFGIPLEDIAKDSAERYKGKVAELALGYQGAVGALLTMGAEEMGLSNSEMKDIVDRWRANNPMIVKYWYDIQEAAIRAIKTKREVKHRNIIFGYINEYLTVRLPSGRKLYYRNPTLRKNQWGYDSIKYEGVNQDTKKWELVDTYGGKLVENIVQSVARDILADSMLRLKDNYCIVMHVHDEIIFEVPDAEAEEALEDISIEMGKPIAWAVGLPLAAEGFISTFYKKD